MKTHRKTKKHQNKQCFEAMKANVPGPAFIQERTFSIKNSLDKENCGKVAQTRFEM